MEDQPAQIPTATRALFREIFPSPISRLRAYGMQAVLAITEVAHSVDDALAHGRAPEALETLRQQREAERHRKFAAWAAEHCSPVYRETLLAESQVQPALGGEPTE